MIVLSVLRSQTVKSKETMQRNNTLYENTIGAVTMTGPIPRLNGSIPARPDRYAIRVTGASENIRQGQTISSFLLGRKSADESKHQIDMVGFMVTMSTVPTNGQQWVDWPIAQQVLVIGDGILHHSALADNAFAKAIRQSIELGAKVRLFKIVHIEADFMSYDVLCIDLLFETAKMQELTGWPKVTPHTVTDMVPMVQVNKSPRQWYRQQFITSGLYIDDRLARQPYATIRAATPVRPLQEPVRRSRRQNGRGIDIHAPKPSKSARRRQRKRLAEEERQQREQFEDTDEHVLRQEDVFQSFQTMAVSDPE